MKTIGGEMELAHCTLFEAVLYLYHVWCKYTKGFQSYLANTICILKFTKGHNSVKTVGGVTALIHCTLSDVCYLVFH